MASKKQSIAGEALGLFTDFVQGVRQELKQRGGTDKQLELLREGPIIAAIVSLILSPVRGAIEFLDRTLSISMDMSKTMAQLIAAGGYDWVKEGINCDFTIEVGGETRAVVDIHLLRYNEDISTDAVLADMERQGLRPATLQELLWIGIRYPELQRKFPIIALGTMQQFLDDRVTPTLDRNGLGRILCMLWLGHDWGHDCRFPAVRK